MIAERIALFLVCGALLFPLCKMWVKRDYQEIKQAEGKHELLKKFHRQGLIWKVASGSVLGLSYALLGFGLTWYALLAFACYSVFAMGFWWYFFSRWLNVRRKLSLWYIGKSAGTDQWLRKQAVKLGIPNQHLINRVKLPLLFLGLVGCVVVAFLGS